MILVGLLYGAAALCAGLLWRSRLRWRRIGARPVLTCAEVAAIEPGTAVTVAGRTADGPTLVAPLSGAACVWYETVRRRTRIVSSNYEETTDSSQEFGDTRLYGEQGASLWVDPDLGKRQLVDGRPAMMRVSVWDRDGGRDPVANSYDRLFEYIVRPDQVIVVTGVVERVDGDARARRLRKGSWVDGGAEASLDELPGRYVLAQRWRLGLLLLFAVPAVVLTGVVAAP